MDWLAPRSLESEYTRRSGKMLVKAGYYYRFVAWLMLYAVDDLKEFLEYYFDALLTHFLLLEK